MSKDVPKGSPFKNTIGWKQGTVRDVVMLPRNQMYKPEAAQQHPSLRHAFPMTKFSNTIPLAPQTKKDR